MNSILSDFKGDLKLLEFPEARNILQFRIENLADLYDGTPADTPTFNIGEYA